MSKQRKRGLNFPTRLTVAAFLIILQIASAVWLINYLSGKTFLVYIILQIISLFLVAYIINKRGNPNYKIAWIIFILGLPLVGAFIYLLWGSGIRLPKIRHEMEAAKRASRPLLEQNPLVENKLNYSDMLHSRQSKYLRKDSGFPVYTDTSVEYLSPGEKFFPKLLEELRGATDYIFMEFFILAEGYMWDEIHKILMEKVAQGVEIRIIFDDFGSIFRQYKGFVKNLRDEGIKVTVFNPIRPSVDIFLNNRNHRKIVVIDGRVSMTGGINIGDEYINKVEHYGYWMDCAAIFRGAATKSFAIMFCQMWNCINPHDKLDYEKYIVRVFPPCEGFVQPYADDPLGRQNPAEGLYMQILGSAQKYVYIASPYLILDNTMLSVLCYAAKSGIDVKIITPKKWDKWYVHPVTQFYYGELLEAGVKIYEFTPGFMHSKLFVSDDRVATIGSVNTDYRSFYFHFECGAWMCNNQAVYDIKDHFLRIIEDCEEIIPEKWAKRPIKLKIKQTILHLFAPFM
ncbi:MAG: cardiolipin synthase [Oscillospiraceae bacterium]